jgi:hypothetical protein
MFQETDRKMREMARQIQEIDRKVEEMARQMKETGREEMESNWRAGDWEDWKEDYFGKVPKRLLRRHIQEKFDALNYTFTVISYETTFHEPAWSALSELDYRFEGNEAVMAVKIETKLCREDVEELIRLMELLRAFLDSWKNRKKTFGAVATEAASDDMREYVLARGFYLIEPSGDTVKVTVPEGFTPRVW